jgi:hypothetical protein
MWCGMARLPDVADSPVPARLHSSRSALAARLVLEAAPESAWCAFRPCVCDMQHASHVRQQPVGIRVTHGVLELQSLKRVSSVGLCVRMWSIYVALHGT